MSTETELDLRNAMRAMNVRLTALEILVERPPRKPSFGNCPQTTKERVAEIDKRLDAMKVERGHLVIERQNLVAGLEA
jgi:hypothetical protein